MRVWAENGMNVAPQVVDVAAAEAVFFFGQHDDAAAFGRFVGQRGELRGVGQFGNAHAVGGNELDRLAIAQRDRAGLVEQQHVDVAGRFDGAAGHGDHVGLNHAVHAGDADGREQAADRRRNQADEQRDEHGDRDRHALPGRVRRCTCENGSSVAQTSRKMIVIAASRMSSAISFGVFCRLAPSTSAIMRSRNVSPDWR